MGLSGWVSKFNALKVKVTVKLLAGDLKTHSPDFWGVEALGLVGNQTTFKGETPLDDGVYLDPGSNVGMVEA